MKKQHPYSLSRTFSLGRNKQYKIVYRRGKSFPGRSMVLVYLRDGRLKAGFSVSAKVGCAVTRNRLRRWMREDFRMIHGRLKTGKYVFAARTAAAHSTHQAMTEEMVVLLKKANLFREGSS